MVELGVYFGTKSSVNYHSNRNEEQRCREESNVPEADPADHRE